MNVHSLTTAGAGVYETERELWGEERSEAVGAERQVALFLLQVGALLKKSRQAVGVELTRLP